MQAQNLDLRKELERLAGLADCQGAATRTPLALPKAPARGAWAVASGLQLAALLAYFALEDC